ncbi:MAG: DnrO protein [Rudaea sp.]
MKPLNLAIALACALGSASAARPASNSPHEDHAGHAATAPAPVPAQRWATDAPLREGMRRVHSALRDLHHYELGHLPESVARERVVAIEDATGYMIAHCKLAPAPDAALHGMLAPLLAGAAALKKDPKDLAAVSAMRNAVADYPRYFDDPQWPLKPAPAGVKHDAM